MYSALATSHATGVLSVFWLIPVIPLVSAAILLGLNRWADRWGHVLGVLSVLASFVLGLIGFIQLAGLPENARAVEVTLFDFIPVGSLNVTFGLLFDPLAGIFVLLI